MHVLELFSGSGVFSKTARELGYTTTTVDLYEKADLQLNIMDFELSMLPKKPDLVWASPPCEKFSRASGRRYWRNGIPSPEVEPFIELAKKTMSIIREANCPYFVENPVGHLANLRIIKGRKWRLSYCSYGLEYQKPTNIWTNTKWIPRPFCTHHRHKVTVNDMRSDGLHRATLPPELCLDILISWKRSDNFLASPMAPYVTVGG